jgi:two-component system response regulator
MRPLRILHVEDNEEDLILLSRACNAAGLSAVFHQARDAFQAVRYLRGEGEFCNRECHPLPDLIVLDLNLPGMGGIDFLKWLRCESGISLPVLVFTISGSAEDKARALAEGAVGYFVKPKEFETMVQLAESFRQFAADGLGKDGGRRQK